MTNENDISKSNVYKKEENKSFLKKSIKEPATKALGIQINLGDLGEENEDENKKLSIVEKILKSKKQ